MSTTEVARPPLEALGDALHDELRHARARLREAQDRRRRLEQDLDTAAAEEDSARRSVEALEAIETRAAAAGVVITGPRDDVREVAQVEAENELHEVDPLQQLAGAQLREMAVRVALRRGAVGQPAHWRDWHGWLREAGYNARGKKPEATFLTQLTRSPLVARAGDEGVYVLDLSLFARAAGVLQELHAQLGALPAPGQTTLLGDLTELRERRRDLQARAAQAERELSEIVTVLSHEPPPGYQPYPGEPSNNVVEAWINFWEASMRGPSEPLPFDTAG